jgi:hypothetical protein
MPVSIAERYWIKASIKASIGVSVEMLAGKHIFRKSLHRKSEKRTMRFEYVPTAGKNSVRHGRQEQCLGFAVMPAALNGGKNTITHTATRKNRIPTAYIVEKR